MGDKSSIEWTDATWNCIYGCSHVSEGCRNCYAERLAPKMHVDFGKIKLMPGRLDIPLRWKRPRKIFVNSLSDLFHEDVPEDFILQIFAVMAIAERHIFQVLTKRPARMLEFMKVVSEKGPSRLLYNSVKGLFHKLGQGQLGPEDSIPTKLALPLPNVWLGVSVEDQKTADERIPILLQTPAVVRWISAEPLLGPINFLKPITVKLGGTGPKWEYRTMLRDCTGMGDWHSHNFSCPGTLIDWIVVGGESGPGARPMHPDWARSLRDQCQAAGVPFFFKQWGEWLACPVPDQPHLSSARPTHHIRDGQFFERVGKKKAGRLLAGREWSEFPGQEKQEVK